MENARSYIRKMCPRGSFLVLDFKVVIQLVFRGNGQVKTCILPASLALHNRKRKMKYSIVIKGSACLIVKRKQSSNYFWPNSTISLGYSGVVGGYGFVQSIIVLVSDFDMG